MNIQPKLTSLGLWADFERRCLRLVREALATLTIESPSTVEIDLNRNLHSAITSAASKTTEYGPYFPAAMLDARNLPSASDPARSEREFKMPDISWAYVDTLADEGDDINKSFVVECKRLTMPSAVYGRRYVRDGIDRFINSSHSYAKGMPSGAMVGYVQTILINDAIISVDTVTTTDTIPHLVLQQRDAEQSAEFSHILTRPTPQPTLRLIHLWGRVGPLSTT